MIWPLINKNETVFAVGSNMALLSPLYIAFFYFTGPIIKKMNDWFFSSVLKKSTGAKDIQILNWIGLKTLFTPLELLSMGVRSENINALFLFTGASQVTVASVFVMSRYAAIPLIDVLFIFCVQVFILVSAFSIFRFNFKNYSQVRARDHRKKIVFTLCAVAPLFLTVGYLADLIFEAWTPVLIENLKPLFNLLPISQQSATEMARQSVLKWFLTERSLFFHWQQFGVPERTQMYWASLLSLLNYFNIFSISLVGLLAVIWVEGSWLQKMKVFFTTLLLAFAVSHGPVLIYLSI